MVKQMISDLVKNAPEIPTWVLTQFKDPLVELEKSIRKKSSKKNVKIFFSFSPSCRSLCRRSLPVYKRLSDGRMFNRSDFSSESFYKSVVQTVMQPCPHSKFKP